MCVQVCFPSASPYVHGDDKEVESCDGEEAGVALTTSTRGKPFDGALSSSPLEGPVALTWPHEYAADAGMRL